MSYSPEVNDYVIWKDHIQGWVYFKDKEYITIEVLVRPKDSINYKHCNLHRNDRLLVICFRHNWKELEYVKKRKSIHEE